MTVNPGRAGGGELLTASAEFLAGTRAASPMFTGIVALAAPATRPGFPRQAGRCPGRCRAAEEEGNEIAGYRRRSGDRGEGAGRG
jgi:hypothetical protein